MTEETVQTVTVTSTGTELANQESSTPETVSKEAYEQVKADMHKFKTQFKEKETALGEMATRIESLQTESLKKEKNYKELYERAEEQKTTAVNEASTIKESYLNDRRLGEIEKEALSQGMDMQSLELLRSGAFDTDSVITETTSTGRVNVLGAKDFIEDLKQKWGTKLFSSGKAPTINSATPTTLNLQDQTLSGKDVLKLQKENPAAYKAYVTKRLKG